MLPQKLSGDGKPNRHFLNILSIKKYKEYKKYAQHVRAMSASEIVKEYTSIYIFIEFIEGD